MSKSTTSIPERSTSSLADVAHQVTERIIQLRKEGEVLISELVPLLKEVKDKELWKINGYESFYAYLAQPELAFDRRTVLYWIQIYETFIEKYALHPDSVAKIGWTKLAKIVPYVNDNNYKFMLELAESNSRSDIDRELVKQHYITKEEYDWTINTVRNKIAEILPKIEPKEEMTEFERRWKKQ